MTKQELLESALADVPDDELLFVVRGSHPAAPETLREYARRVLHFDRIHPMRSLTSTAQARVEADAAFAMADRMDANHADAREAERLAGLTANDENEKLVAENMRLKQAVEQTRMIAENERLRAELLAHGESPA